MTGAPWGKGLYCRKLREHDASASAFADRLHRAGFAWAALNPHTNSVGDVDRYAAALRERGIALWVYGMPHAWAPERWREALGFEQQVAHRIGARGFIADPENGWPEAPASEARALGEALRSAAAVWSVGLTTWPLFRHFDVWADTCGQDVWGSPQIYDRRNYPLDRFGAWLDKWRRRWRVVVPSVDGWHSHIGGTDSPARQRAYFEAIPAVRGAAVWVTIGSFSAGNDYAAAVEAYRPNPWFPPMVERVANRWDIAPPVLVGAGVALCAVAAGALLSRGALA